MISTALREPTTIKTRDTVQQICDEVGKNTVEFDTAWPVFAHYLDAAKIPERARDHSWAPLSFQRDCVSQCIIAIARPSKEHPNLPRIFEREDRSARSATLAKDIFAWAKHMAHLMVANSDQMSWHAYQALSYVFDLLHDVRFCVPDAVDTILASWKSELKSQQLFDMDHVYTFNPTAWGMLELLGKISNPSSQQYPQLPSLRARFMENVNTIVATAFARIDRLKPTRQHANSHDRMRVLELQILETFTRVPGFADLTRLVCPREIRIVTAEYLRFVSRPLEHNAPPMGSSIPTSAQVTETMITTAVAAAMNFLKFALSTRPVTIAFHPAIRGGLLDALCRTSKPLGGPTGSHAHSPTRADTALPVLQFFIEEVILAHMWDRSVFVQILDWVRENQTLAETEMDNRVRARLLGWAEMVSERDVVGSRDHCDYSKVSTAWHKPLG
jgi:hypothetical protein